ncbi:hypothetical protein COLO4_04680 [Corchorus olitorius]|uniref:Uncharacterized protein n=1 Tax=Corchorus olitorius TaxID=93759 RepID=A0A1R3KT83_9ROSI|nr:hypothetical protein COLO4_04680 [Corchorus olitorius]
MAQFSLSRSFLLLALMIGLFIRRMVRFLDKGDAFWLAREV